MAYFVIWTTAGNEWYKSEESNEKTKKITKKSTPVRASAKNENKCIHVIFEKMANVTEDLFWKNIFLDMAKNIPRRGFQYFPNTYTDSCNVGKLVYKSNQKEYLCDVNNDPVISSINVKNFMTEKANIMSEIDKEERNIELSNQLAQSSQIEINSWNSVKNYIGKKMLINSYVEKIALTHGLNAENKHKLLSIIKEGITAGIFDNDRIIVSKDEITEIKGLCHKDGVFYIDPHIIKIFPIKTHKSSKYDESENSFTHLEDNEEYEYKNKNFTTTFEKFVKELNKNFKKN